MAKPDNTLLRKQREEKQEAKNGLKFVIDGAKIRCNSCTIPEGDLKANYDTPSIQDKRVVTVVENDMTSLIFKGNCKKSFLSSSPCASVMKLGEWKNPGTVYFQDELAVLLRSTIKCEYGGVDITIWDCGQRNEITNLNTLGAPIPNIDRIINVNGHFYNKDGTFEGKINESDYEGSVNDVYVCNGKSTQKDKNGNELLTYNNIESLKIKNDVFLRIASLAYSESGFSLDVIKSIPFIVINHHKQLINSKVTKYKSNWFLNDTIIKMRNKWNDETYAHTFHYGAQGNPAFRKFLNIDLNESIDFEKNAKGRNENVKMKTAIEYTIKGTQYFNNEYIDFDYSGGGIGWQGADICTNTNWQKWLYIHSDHKKNAFKNWSNSSILEESIFESVSVFKGDFGTTIIYKSTIFSFKNSTTGNL
ncbi:PAAR-like protein [uncultured Flavobacterium sp.]|uniref:PAAR-like protein n=1 Tax=uncultured Flavobacterium sp. TaxID=165435 RepID=UPI0029306CB0|nr:PAAR-like protein [uncultured Flavobacterium sp.]